MPLRSLLALLMTLCAVPMVAQSTIHVPADQPTIQAGINNAKNGDTVLVSAGTYYENIDFKGKAITVTSSDGAAKTTIDGGNKGAVVTFKSGEPRTAVISNFTITDGGNASGSYWAGYGVAIANSAPTVLNNIITANPCQNIYIGTASPLIQGNEISNSLTPEKCFVLSTGGINMWGDLENASSNLHTEIIGNTIEGNTTGQSGDGGGDGGAGIAVWGGSPQIIGNIIRNNVTRSGNGGGIYIVSGAHVAIVQNLIYGNTSGCGGGALAMWGGGVPLGDTEVLVANNTIGNNTGGTGGGYSDCAKMNQLWGDFDWFSATQVFVNNIFYGNSDIPALNCGSPYYGAGGTELTQPIFDHNILSNASGPFFGNYCVDTSAKYGNIAADPQLVNPGAGDYHLRATSPAIDAGNASALQLLKNLDGVWVAKDFDGNPREQDATGQGYPVIDIGAYEFTGAVNSSPTRLVVSASAYTGPAGSNYTLIGTLSSALGVPTGPVTFFLDGKEIGTANAANGMTTLPNVTLRPGAHIVWATYPGQGAFPQTQSVVVVLSIDKYPDQVTLKSTPDPSMVGQAVTFTVNVSSADQGFIPSPVTLTDNLNTVLTTLTPDANGNATFATSSLTAGTHYISASYAGDSEHAASGSVVQQTVLDPNDTDTALASAPNPAVVGSAVQFTATVKSQGGATPTGSVNFSYNGAVIGSAALTASGASGSASISDSGLPLGYDTVTATYVPTGTFHPSTAAVTEQVISALPTATSLTCSPLALNVGDTLTLTASASAQGSVVPGIFSFSEAGATWGTWTSTTGSSTVSEMMTTAGAHTLQATFTPQSSTYSPSSATCNVTVASYPLVITLSAAPNPATVGQTVTFSTNFAATYPTGNTGHQFTGKLAFYDGTTLLSQIVPSVSGFSFSTAGLAVGTHTITAVYTDPNYGTGTTTSNAVSVTVNALASVATLDLTPTTATYGTAITGQGRVAAAVAPAPTVPTGTVVFTVDGKAMPSSVLANAVAGLALNNLAVGSHQISCSYSGDSTYAASTCNTVTVTVTPAASAFTITSSQNPAWAYTSVTFTIHLALGGQPAPAGTPLTFSLMANSGNVLLYTDASGNATYTTNGLFARTWDTVSVYSGSGANYVSAVTHYEEVVTLNPTTVTLTAAPNPAYVGQAVTLTAAAAASGGAVPAGTVTFLDGTTVLGTGTLDATGHATFTTSGLAVGTHALTASYAGNDGFAAAVSGPVQEVINPSGFTVALNPAALSLKSGTDGTATVQLGTIGNFSGPVQLVVGAGPAYATASLSASTVMLTSGGTGASTLTVKTMALASLRPQDGPRGRRTEEMLAAGLSGMAALALLPWAGGHRRRRMARVLMALLAAVALSGTTGCVNDWYTRHTVAAGTYTLPVVATDSHGVSQTANLTLTITP